jgi:hypothetical protein
MVEDRYKPCYNLCIGDFYKLVGDFDDGKDEALTFKAHYYT